MKTLLKIFFLIAIISLVAGCNNDESLVNEENLLLKNAELKTVTTGFNIIFTGNYDAVFPDDICGEFPPMVRILNNGKGTGTHLGHLTSHFDFCVNVIDGTYPNGHIEAFFEDENGDLLYVTVAGTVLPGRLPGMPSFAVEYFTDPFVITGGTGRFEGATGSGWTNDYNSEKDPYSHHHWQGKITLIKGKK